MEEVKAQESKEFSVTLDSKSIGILKKVDNIHKSSMINIGLALIEKTGYYKTLCNNPVNTIEEVVSLSVESLGINGVGISTVNPTKVEAPKVTKKPSTDWDSF